MDHHQADVARISYAMFRARMTDVIEEAEVSSARANRCPRGGRPTPRGSMQSWSRRTWKAGTWQQGGGKPNHVTSLTTVSQCR
jgi:hypothetical protein